jgi:DnaJ domain
MLWVLSLSNGLLKAFNARYAAFSFDNEYVLLDVLPVWSRKISRFLRRRSEKKPAEDLKSLILHSGAEWYSIIHNRNSRSYATLFLLSKNYTKRVAPDSIKPDQKMKPRLSKGERQSIKLLELKLEELFSDGHILKIKSAYKKLAKIHHPDMGGDAEEFKKLNAAHQQMLLWAEKPHFTLRKALIDCWSYDGVTNEWSPPL